RRAWGLCLEDGIQLFSQVTQTPPGSSCEAEIYAGAMAAQELHWLTYLLTDLGEQPRSPPVLYVDNKAMIALCLEHRTKQIAQRYFLARELQQRGQLRLAYVATRANIADVFTKALPPAAAAIVVATFPQEKEVYAAAVDVATALTAAAALEAAAGHGLLPCVPPAAPLPPLQGPPMSPQRWTRCRDLGGSSQLY
ncbi:unnamed protein product, partial [Closterium sp. NIES-53]